MMSNVRGFLRRCAVIYSIVILIIVIVGPAKQPDCPLRFEVLQQVRHKSTSWVCYAEPIRSRDPGG